MICDAWIREVQHRVRGPSGLLLDARRLVLLGDQTIAPNLSTAYVITSGSFLYTRIHGECHHVT